MSESNLTRVTWWEIPVPDLAEAERFYGAVFGWTFQPFGEGFAAIFTNDNEMVGGLDGTRERAVGDGVAVYVNVEDLDDTLRKVVEAGGKVAREPADIGEDMGWWAAFTDPGGRWIGLCSDAAPAGRAS